MDKRWIALLIIGGFLLWYGFKSDFLAVGIGSQKSLQEGINLMKS